MTEEDEIDILGDFSLDNLLSKNETAIFDNSNLVSQNTDLLNCDYTIHPQWLLDKPSANPACWYNTTSSDFTTTLSNDSSNYSFEQSNTSNNLTESITDESGWTDKEKDLLNRGIEIFGKSNVRLAQFIGSKSAAEVKYFLKNFYSDIQLTCSDNLQNEIVFEECIQENSGATSSYSEVIDDTEIPASIEEVIASVTTAKPTVNTSSKKKGIAKSVSYSDIPSGHSLLKKNFLLKGRQFSKFNNKNIKPKKVKNVDNQTALDNEKHAKRLKKLVKFKFKTNIKMPQKINKLKPRKHIKSESSDTSSVAEIVTGNGLSVPVCSGEQVIKIQKENQDSESDVEIDIEDTDTPSNGTITKNETIKENKIIIVKNEYKEEIVLNNKDDEKEVILKAKKLPDLNALDDEVKKELENLDVPKSEITLELNKISELEKVIHYEFFEGRSIKTPSRYLKIRNHIIHAWMITKPAYVTKTSIRKGLQQCGDVNCIGRIHNYLEQIGAINFNCAQTSYIRPLSELIYINTKEKPNKSEQEIRFKMDLQRPRLKTSKSLNNGEGGCTITHNEQGEVINTTVINEEPVQKPRNYIKKPIIKLIYCRPFTDHNRQKFTIHLHLSTLILMDLHAHISLNEVMGLVGGQWNEEQKILTISRYEPCRNIAPSSTHCDMCPISQANAASVFHTENMEILGWFHSHPTFAPEPSQQDLDTQLSVQQWIGNSKPCIGVILSPFSLHGALIASPYRCMIVDKKEHFEDQYVPYRLRVEIISNNINMDSLLNRAWRIFNTDCNVKEENRINFKKGYFQDQSLTHLDKFISSIKIHLAKCTDINKMTCDAIIEGLSNICCNNL